MVNPLYQHKSAITRRRLIIAFILCTIITVSIMTGFSKGLDSDGTIYTAEGTRIVMWNELPESGTPEDFDALTSFKYVAQRLYTAPYFKGDTVGDVVADLGIMKYKQHVHNTRVVKNGDVFSEAISSSSAKSIAEQKYIEGDIIIYRPSVKVSGDNVTWSDSAFRLAKEDYFRQYGVIPLELAKHAIDEQTILSVRDNNAALQKSTVNDAQSDGDETVDEGGVAYDVPQTLVKGDDGYYSITFELDPYESTKYSRNEMRTLAGADNNPVISYVAFTLVFDERFIPISVSTAERYDIEIPFLGAMSCSSTLTETFYDVGGDGELPYLDFFKSHMTDESGGEIPDAPKSPADYLANAFGAYMDGSKTLDLAADIAIGDMALNGLKISVDIAEMNVKAQLGNLYIEYAGDRVYLTKGDIKGYITVDKFKTLLENETVSGLLSSASLPDIDFDKLLGGDILGKLFENCEMTTENGVTRIRLPFELADGITIDASLYVKDEGMELQRIAGNVNAFGTNVSIDAVPTVAAFPAVDSDYADFDPIVDFISDAMNTALGGTTYGIKGDIEINGNTIGVDAYIDRTDGAVTADGTVSAYGVTVDFKYVNGTIYIKVGNIKLAATISDLPELIGAIGGIVDTDATDFGQIETILPRTLPEITDVLDSLTVTDEKLSVGLKLGDIPAYVELTRGGGLITGVKANVSVDITDIKLDLSADITITRPDRHTVSASDANSYSDIAQLKPTLEAAARVIAEKSLAADFEVTVGGTDIRGNLAVAFDDGLSAQVTLDDYPVEVTIYEKALYVAVGNIKLTGSTADVPAIIDALGDIIPEQAVATIDKILGALNGDSPTVPSDFDITSIVHTALDALISFKIENGEIKADIAVGDTTIGVTAKADLSMLTVAAAFGDIALTAKLNNVKEGATIAAPDKSQYTSVSEFLPLISPIAPLFLKDGYAMRLEAELYGIAVSGDVYISLPDETHEAVAVKLIAQISDVRAEITYINDKLYIAVGDVKLTGGTTRAEIEALISALSPVVPQIDGIIDMITGISSVEIDLTAVINAVTELSATADGATLAIDLGELGAEFAATLNIAYDNGLPVSATVDAAINGNAIAFTLGIAVENGELAAISCDEYGVSVRLTDTSKQQVTAPTGDFIDVAVLAQYIEPLFELIEQAKTAQSVRMNISAYALTSENKQMKIEGHITVAMFPSLAVDATLDLFAGTDAQEPIYIRYTENVLYIKAGGIKLSFDTNNDVGRIVGVLANYLPEYLIDELNVMLGLQDGESALSTSNIIINAIKEAARQQTVEGKLSALFSPVDGGRSAVGLLIDMVGLSSANGVTAHVDVMGVSLSATPNMSDGELIGVTVATNVAGIKIEATVSDITFSDSATAIPVPDDSDEYVSVAEFIETIGYAIGTFTARDEQGNITFEITDFEFTYAEKERYDEAGNKISETVNVRNIDGKSALKGKIVPAGENDDGTHVGSAFELEAHIVLSIDSLVNYGDINISLYIKDETAYIDYFESKTGYGERVSIDYTSVMQIVAAAVDILGVRGEAIDDIIGAFRQPIDTSIFESMNIIGLDSLQTMLNDLAGTVQNAKNAINKISEAWNIVITAGSTENLRAQLDTVKALIGEALAPFGKDGNNGGESSRSEYEQIDGSLFGKIVNGVTLKKTGNYIWADVDNGITTGGTGRASVVVTQGDGVINGIDISDLDVKTADIKGSVRFISGGEVNVVVPPEVTQTDGNTTYSDLSNIKHLLFDVMNTANLMEFEIGDNTSTGEDFINVQIKVIGISINIDIAYSVKVKIIPQTDGGFKTAAIVDFVFKDISMGVIPDCSTRLTFYDDTFYVEGLAWRQERVKKLGTWRYKTFTEPVSVAYTLGDFTDMISNDMNKLLYDFLFYLLPLKIDYMSVPVPFDKPWASIGTNLQKTIAGNIVGDGSSTSAATPTLATVFKGYSYADGKHTATIGLKELTGSSTLGDVTVDIIGKNDNDDNLLDNYLSKLNVTANLVNVTACSINLNLKATLRNVTEYTDDEGTGRIKSSGITPTVIGDRSYDIDSLTADYIPSVEWTAGSALTLPDWLAWA